MLPHFHFLGQILYSYPLMMGIALGIFFYSSKHLNKNLSEKQFIKLIAFLFVGAFLGAKFLYLIASDKFQSIEDSSFWLGGGFVFYGGAIGSSLALFIYMKLENVDLSKLCFIIPPIILSHSVGRLGCYLAGCCYGQLLLPIQLLESFILLLGFILFYRRYEIWKEKAFYYYGISYAIVRFILEFYRDDYMRGLWFLNFSTSQIISTIVIVLCVLAICFNKPNKYAKS